jgi:uncharacterized membrane protein YhaH (DUF805 family)
MRKSVLDYIVHCFTQGFWQFDGRARRAEYWSFMLIVSVVGAILSPIKPLALIFFAACLFPSFAVSARRLHDIGRSGRWHLLLFIPFVGWFTYLVFVCLPGHPDDNRYGPDPKV